jgi:hypothetical protein
MASANSSPIVRGVDWAAHGVSAESLEGHQLWVRNPLALGDLGMSLVAPACALLWVEDVHRTGDEDVRPCLFGWTYRACQRYVQRVPALGPLRELSYVEEIGGTVKGGCGCCKFLPVRWLGDYGTALNTLGCVVTILGFPHTVLK